MNTELLSRFQKASGLDDALCVAVGEIPARDSDRGCQAIDVPRHRFEFPCPVVGRDESADLRLDAASVSRHHACLIPLAGRIFVFDLDSRRGLVWDGGRARSGWLGPERGVDIGPFRLLATNPPPASASEDDNVAPIDDPLASYPEANRLLPPLTFEPIARAAADPWTMRPALAFIGRSNACRLRVDDLDVSRFEAVVIRTPTGPWVAGLCGRAGIRVNGERTRLAPLAQGDELRVGSLRLRASLESGLLALPGPRGARGKTLATRVKGETGVGRVRSERIAAAPTAMPGPAFPWVASPEHAALEPLQIAMQMMGQWFGTLYQEQSSRIQSELEQLVRLNREIAELVGRLSAADAARAVSEPAPRQEPEAAGARPASGAAKRVSIAGPQPKREPVVEEAPQAGPKEVDQTSQAHAQLLQRIEILQREQRGRWRRMMDLVAGKAV